MTSPFTQRSSSSVLDIAVAALATASVAFVVFAMPGDIFANLVAMSRLPEFVAAAQPPYGQTARFAALAGAALITFGLVFSLLRGLDSIPSRRRPTPGIVDEEAPRLRRADAHPDAPSRRPLLAGHELGEPIEEDTPWLERDEPSAELEAQPLPAFLVPDSTSEPEFEAQAEVVEAQADTEAEAVEAEAEAAPEPEVLELTEQEPQGPDILSARLPRTAEAGGEESVSKLMRRLEGGLSRRRKPAPIETFEEEAEPQPVQDRVGHRLRSAISDLQKISAPGG